MVAVAVARITDHGRGRLRPRPVGPDRRARRTVEAVGRSPPWDICPFRPARRRLRDRPSDASCMAAAPQCRGRIGCTLTADVDISTFGRLTIDVAQKTVACSRLLMGTMDRSARTAMARIALPQPLANDAF